MGPKMRLVVKIRRRSPADSWRFPSLSAVASGSKCQIVSTRAVSGE